MQQGHYNVSRIAAALSTTHFTPFAMLAVELCSMLAVLSGRFTRLKAIAMETDAHTEIKAEMPACTQRASVRQALQDQIVSRICDSPVGFPKVKRGSSMHARA